MVFRLIEQGDLFPAQTPSRALYQKRAPEAKGIVLRRMVKPILERAWLVFWRPEPLAVLVRELTVSIFNACLGIHAVELATVLRTAGPREEDASPKMWKPPPCSQDRIGTKGRTDTFIIIHERYVSTPTAHGLMYMFCHPALRRRRNVVLRIDAILP